MPSYPPPAENPNCHCYPNMMAAMFCMEGHMLECHAGMSCAEAQCSHYEAALQAEAEEFGEDELPNEAYAEQQPPNESGDMPSD